MRWWGAMGGARPWGVPVLFMMTPQREPPPAGDPGHPSEMSTVTQVALTTVTVADTPTQSRWTRGGDTARQPTHPTCVSSLAGMVEAARGRLASAPMADAAATSATTTATRQ